jgi:hypothetical protein
VIPVAPGGPKRSFRIMIVRRVTGSNSRSQFVRFPKRGFDQVRLVIEVDPVNLLKTRLYRHYKQTLLETQSPYTYQRLKQFSLLTHLRTARNEVALKAPCVACHLQILRSARSGKPFCEVMRVSSMTRLEIWRNQLLCSTGGELSLGSCREW